MKAARFEERRLPVVIPLRTLARNLSAIAVIAPSWPTGNTCIGFLLRWPMTISRWGTWFANPRASALALGQWQQTAALPAGPPSHCQGPRERGRRCGASLGGETEVTVVAEPDAICDACPNLATTGCTLHGEGSEQGIVRQDRDVMGRLGIVEGSSLPWRAIVERIAAKVEPDDLDAICGSCPWLPLGVCKAGLRKLR